MLPGRGAGTEGWVPFGIDGEGDVDGYTEALSQDDERCHTGRGPETREDRQFQAGPQFTFGHVEFGIQV